MQNTARTEDSSVKINLVFEKIRQYRRIIISRHIHPDGDAVGSSMGLALILRASFPEKEVLVINDDCTESLAFLGTEDPQLEDTGYKGALCIVTDTSVKDRVSNSKYRLADEVIKIDHHVETDPFGNICWVEAERSSASEMITEFYSTLRSFLKLTPAAALCLYTGIVTDSGRFMYNTTTGTTLRYAAMLLDTGIDTDRLYSRLYLEDPAFCSFRAYALPKIKLGPNGTAALYVSREMQKKFSLNTEQAGNAVTFMENMKGCLIWMAFIEDPEEDKKIRVRLRSRFVPVRTLAQKYRGGGHAFASGATVYGKKEAKALFEEADSMLGDWKASNTGWL